MHQRAFTVPSQQDSGKNTCGYLGMRLAPRRLASLRQELDDVQAAAAAQASAAAAAASQVGRRHVKRLVIVV